MLILSAPSCGLDQMFAELDAATAKGMAEIEKVVAVAAKYGVTIEPPAAGDGCYPPVTVAGGTIRDICVGVAFDVLDIVSNPASGVFSGDASVFVSSRVCMMHAR